MMNIKSVKTYRDIELKRIVKCGEVLPVSDERAQHLIKIGYAVAEDGRDAAKKAKGDGLRE